MREIKYRQPLNIGGFHYWGYVQERGGFVGPMGENDASGPSEAYADLKDKNGKEIYEGDVLLVNKGRDHAPVYWDQRMFGFKIKYQPKPFKNWRGFTFSDQVEEECEIIGNIHENPELLKEKTNAN